MFSKVDCGVVCNAVNGLLRKVAVIVPTQVGEFGGNAVVNTPYGVLFVVWRVGINITSSSKILQFATKPPGGGIRGVCSMT